MTTENHRDTINGASIGDAPNLAAAQTQRAAIDLVKGHIAVTLNGIVALGALTPDTAAPVAAAALGEIIGEAISRGEAQVGPVEAARQRQGINDLFGQALRRGRKTGILRVPAAAMPGRPS